VQLAVGWYAVRRRGKSMKASERADKSKIFDTVLATLKETRSAFFAHFISGFALLLSAFGLLFAYEKVKPILESDIIYFFSIVVLMIFSYTYSRHLLAIKDKTKKLVVELCELNYMDKRYFQGYEIKRSEFIPILAANLVMFFAIVLVLTWIKYIAVLSD
jgi:hypothetical protein